MRSIRLTSERTLQPERSEDRRGWRRPDPRLDSPKAVAALLADLTHAFAALNSSLWVRIPGTSKFERDATSELPSAECPQREESTLGPAAVLQNLLAGHTQAVSIEDLRSLDPAAHSYHASRGERALWYAPILWQQELVGLLCVALESLTLPAPEVQEAVADVSNSLLAYVSTRRLAAMSAEAAAAREQERSASARVAAFTRINEGLRRVTERLASAGLNGVMDVFLLEAVSMSGASAGAIHEWVEGTCFRLRALVVNGIAVTPELNHASRARFEEATALDAAGVMARTAAGQTHRIDLANLGTWFPEAADFHSRHQHRSVWHVPYRFAGRVAGFLGLAFTEDRDINDDVIETVQALADQTWLALESHRLAEQAREAAVRRERTLAAEQKAAELAHANRALRRAIVGLASIDSLDAFLAEMLHACLDATGAQGGAVVLIRGEYAEHVVLMENGRRVSREEQEGQGTYRVPINAELRAYIERTRDSGEVWAPPPNEASHTATFVEYHRLRENRSIRNVPLLVSGKVIGWLGLGFATPDPESTASVDLLRTLAEQMTVAVELARLAEESRQVAVAREREAAAEARAAELSRHYSLLRAGAEASRLLLSCSDLHTGLQGAVAALASRTCYGRAYVMAFDPVQDGWISEAVYEHPGLPSTFAVHGPGPFPRSDYLEVFQEHSLRRPFARLTRDVTPVNRAFNEAIGTKNMAMIPIFVGEEYWGLIGFDDCYEANEWTAGEIAILQSVADALSAAIDRQRLEARHREEIAAQRAQAAEFRAALLADANATLHRTLDHLGSRGSVEAFLEALLLEAIRLSGAVAGGLSLWEAGNYIDQACVVQDGVVIRPEVWKQEALFQSAPLVLKGNDGGFRQRLQSEPLTIAPVDDMRNWWPAAHDYHASRGHVEVWNVPCLRRGELVAHIGLGFRQKRVLDATVTSTLASLAHQVSLALELTRLARESRDFAVANERERSARMRSEELARANEALQAVTDALAVAQGESEIVPEVLRIVARTFGVPTVGFYEHPGEVIHLRYWLQDGKVLSPDDLLQPEAAGCSANLRHLARGFRLPTQYLGGIPLWDRTHAMVIDHQQGSAEPLFDEWARDCGWEMELNVPCFVSGRSRWALVMYRGAAEPFSQAEIALAEAVSKQLALALQADRLGAEAREAAVSREREQAALERAAELAKANAVLRRAADGLANVDDLEQVLAVFLRESVAVSGAAAGAVIRRRAGADFECAAIIDEDVCTFGEALRRNPMAVILPECTAQERLDCFAAISRGETRWWRLRDLESWYPEGVAWHRERGYLAAWGVPFVVNGEVLGWLGMAFREEAIPSDVVRETIAALASQIAVALELTDLADAAKEAAVSTALAREREVAADQRAQQLEIFNADLRRRDALLDALASAMAVLAAAEDFDAAATEALGIIARAARMHRATLVEHVYTEGTAIPVAWQVAYEWQDNGYVRQLESPHHTGLLADSPEWVARLLAGHAFIDARTEDLADPALRETQRALGAKYILSAHIEIEGRSWGALSLDDCQEDVPRDAVEKAVLAAAARGFGLAIHRHRSREQSAHLQRELIEERRRRAEEQAAELSQANDALTRTVDQLASVSDSTAFFHAALMEMASALDARSGALMLFEPEGQCFRLAASVVDGVPQNVLGSAHERGWSLEEQVIAEAWEEIRRADPLRVIDIESPVIHPETRAWHRVRGDHSILVLPLFRGSSPLGFAAFGRNTTVPAGQVKAELARALSQQLVLALELMRLAEEARSLAVAQERELAAANRAAELDRANRLLEVAVRASRTLLNTLSFDRACPSVLADLGHCLDVFRVAVGRLEWPDPFHPTCELIHEWSALGSMRQMDRPDLRRLPLALTQEQLQALVRGEGVQSLVEDMPEPYRTQQQATGSAAGFVLPIFVEDQLWGVLGIDDHVARRWTTEEGRFLSLIGDAMSAAIQRERAEMRRQEELAVERELAAQERMRQLARANEALQGTVNRLAKQPDLDSFLSRLLAEVTSQLSSRMGVITLYDDPSDSMRIGAMVVDGEEAPLNSIPERYPLAHLGFVQRILTDSGYGEFDITRDAHLFWPGTVAFLRENGMQACVSFPIRLGDRLLGQIAVAYPRAPEFTPDNVALVHALSSQAALGIHLTQLAAEARQFAVAREREAAAEFRAAELSKINEALRRSVDGLAQSSDITSIHRVFLREVMRVTHADAGAVLRRVGDSTQFEVALVCTAEGFSDGRELAANPLVAEIARVSGEDRLRYFEALCRGEWKYRAVESELATDLPLTTAYHLTAGRKAMWDIPFAVSGTVTGYLSLVFTDEAAFGQTITEAIKALATQVGLAVELTQFAEESRQLAVSRERESASRQRAADLAAANEALRRSSAQLVSIDDLGGFLRELCVSAADVSGAALAGVVLVRPNSSEPPYSVYVLDTASASEQADADNTPALALELLSVWTQVAAAGTCWSASYDDLAIPEHAKRYHRQHGHQHAAFVPIRANGECIGAIVLAFSKSGLPADPRMEMLGMLSEQASLAIELTRLADQAREATRLTATAEERTRVARELHDTLLQEVAGIAWQLDSISRDLPGDPALSKQRLDRVLEQVDQCLKDARRTITSLRQTQLQSTLVRSIDALGRQLAKRAGFQFRCVLHGTLPSLSPPLETEAFAILREALLNAAQHSRAKTLGVDFTGENSQCVIEVHDDGIGFDASALAANPIDHWGLVGMRERARALGGSCVVSSQPGTGTVVRLVIPVGPPSVRT